MSFSVDSYLDTGIANANFYGAISDGTYLYYVSVGWPVKIAKISIAGFTKVGELELNSGSIYYGTEAITTDGTYLYIGTINSSSKLSIVKIAISSFSAVSTLVLNSYVPETYSPAIYDPVNSKIYFTTYQKILKIDIATFTLDSALDVGSANRAIACLEIDSDYLYFGNNIGDSRVVRVSLTTFTISDYIDTSAYKGIVSATQCGGKLYFGTHPAVGETGAFILKIDIASFSLDTALHLPSGEYWIDAGVIDSSCTYGYFTSSVGYVIKVRLSDFTRVDRISLAANDYGLNIIMESDYLYLGSNDDSGKIAKCSTSLPISSILMYKFRPVVLT
jgi:hypothetical protein